MEFVKLTEKEFADFAEHAQGCNFLQSIYMYRRYQKKHQECYLLGVKSAQKVILAGLVVATRRLGKWKIFNAPGGVLGDYSQPVLEVFTTGVKNFLKSKSGMVLMISPNLISTERDIDAKPVPGGEDNLKIKASLERLHYRYLGEYIQAKWVYVLPTKNANPEEIYKNFRKGHKLSIRYAKPRYGVKIRELKVSELEILQKLCAESGDFHGFQAPSITYFQEMKAAFKDHCKFMVAEMPDPETGKTIPVAGAMFILYGNEIVYLFSGSHRQYKKYGGPHLMQWQMIQRAIKDGYAQYNFYGVRPEPGNGVYAFKRGFKGTVVELLGTFMLPLNLPGKIYTLTRKVQKFGKIA